MGTTRRATVASVHIGPTPRTQKRWRLSWRRLDGTNERLVFDNFKIVFFWQNFHGGLRVRQQWAFSLCFAVCLREQDREPVWQKGKLLWGDRSYWQWTIKLHTISEEDSWCGNVIDTTTMIIATFSPGFLPQVFAIGTMRHHGFLIQWLAINICWIPTLSKRWCLTLKAACCHFRFCCSWQRPCFVPQTNGSKETGWGSCVPHMKSWSCFSM